MARGARSGAPRYSATVQTRSPSDSGVTAQAALGKRQSLTAVQRGRRTEVAAVEAHAGAAVGALADWAAAAVHHFEQKRTVREAVPLVRVLERHRRVSLWQGSLGEQAW